MVNVHLLHFYHNRNILLILPQLGKENSSKLFLIPSLDSTNEICEPPSFHLLLLFLKQQAREIVKVVVEHWNE